jgi:hypothetical protein
MLEGSLTKFSLFQREGAKNPRIDALEQKLHKGCSFLEWFSL